MPAPAYAALGAYVKKIALAIAVIFEIFSIGAARAESVKIYVVAPLTGAQESFGNQIGLGVRAAIADNQATLADKQIEFRFIDDRCEKESAIKIAEELAEGHARLVLGHVCSVASIPAAPIYEAHKIVMLSAASSNSALTESGLSYVFRVSGRDDLQAESASAMMKGRFPNATFAVLFEDDISGQGHSAQFVRKMSELGRAPVVMLPIKGAGEVPAVVTHAELQRADVIYYAGHQPEILGLLLKTARQQGIRAQFLSNDGANNKAVWSFSDGAAQGLLFTFDPKHARQSTAKAAMATLKKAGSKGDGFTLPAYAAAEILVQAAMKMRDDPSADPQTYLHTTTFNTALGPVSFDAKGDFRQFHGMIYRWSDGEAQPDEP
jgi:branched-chain amino acid transport system substrate-binding protein